MTRLIIDHVSIRSGSGPFTSLADVRVAATLAPVEWDPYAELCVESSRIHAQLREGDTASRRAGELQPHGDGCRKNSVLSELVTVDLRERAVLTNHVARHPNAGRHAGADQELGRSFAEVRDDSIAGLSTAHMRSIRSNKSARSVSWFETSWVP